MTGCGCTTKEAVKGIKQSSDQSIKNVCFQEHCFDVELAITPEERARGLMHKKHLEQEKGMLFIFPAEAEYSFWMKNTLIPLDIIWINKDKKVVFINSNTLPCTSEQCDIIKPNKKASYVLEINVGMADEVNLTIGSQLSFK